MHFSSFILPLLFPSNTHRSGPYSGAAWSPHWNARRETQSGSHLQEEISVSARSWQPILLLEEKAAAISHTNKSLLALRHFLCLTMSSSFPEGENSHF